MNDIRSALAAAMHSQAGVARGNTAPIKSVDDGRIQASALQSGQDTRRPERRGGKAETGPRESKSGNREVPRNWTTSDKEAFKALPEATQDFILRQCRSIETELANRSERMAAFHREYEPVAKMLEPFAGRLKDLNLTPRTAIQRYIDIERRLATGDGVAVIKALVDFYKVAPEQVIEALGSKLSDTQHVPLSYPPQINRHPSVNARQHAATLRNFESQLEQFKTAEGAAGNRLYPHYADVEPDMAAIALAYSSRGHTIPPLKELYERAVWTNPALRGALVSAQQGSSTTTPDAEAKPRTVARRPASTSNTDESKRTLTRQSSRRSLRDEILAHAGGA
jgi:hypothetical protein